MARQQSPTVVRVTSTDSKDSGKNSQNSSGNLHDSEWKGKEGDVVKREREMEQ